MISWCVAHTQPMKELVAAEHLINQGFEVYVPRYKKTKRHARKVEEVLAPLFPRYIFVGMDLNKALWRNVNGTRGISYLLQSDQGNRPAVVPTNIIEELKAQETGEGILPIGSLVSFVKGDKLLVLEGAFKDQTVVFEALDANGRVQLLLNLLGREMKISLPLYAVDAA